MKVKSTAALLVALAAALGSCGGDDAKPSAERTAATGATGVAQPAGKEPSSQPGTSTGTGGAKQPKSDGGRASTPSSGSTSGSATEGSGKRDKPSRERTSGKKKGTATTIEELSPAEREKLHKDLYIQGKNLCSAYTPAQLAQQYNITATRAADVARAYAELYEQGNPSLVLPYQQGCLAGFKKRARETRNAGDGTGG